MKEKYIEIIDNNLDKNFIINSENCTWDKIYNSKNAQNCYIADNFEDVKFCEIWYEAKDCFWCVGLKNSKYCILNKQYKKQDYFKLKEKIINYIIDTWEFWEFFPMQNSPYCYNETLAQNTFKLSKKEILDLWLDYKEEEKQEAYTWPEIKIPENIKKTSDSILKEVLKCKTCSKNYKIIKQELSFYKKIWISLPESCFKCRNLERIKIIKPVIF